MSVTATPHVNFRGGARKALEFYQSVFGGDISIATYADIHSAEDPAQAGQVAFGRVTAPNGFDIMAHDVQPSKGYHPGENAFLLHAEQAERRYGVAAHRILQPSPGAGPLNGAAAPRARLAALFRLVRGQQVQRHADDHVFLAADVALLDHAAADQQGSQARLPGVDQRPHPGDDRVHRFCSRGCRRSTCRKPAFTEPPLQAHRRSRSPGYEEGMAAGRSPLTLR